MSGLMRAWNFAGTPPNPPDANRISSNLTLFANISLIWPMYPHTRPIKQERSLNGACMKYYSDWQIMKAHPVQYESFENSPLPIGNVYGKTYTLAWFLTP